MEKFNGNEISKPNNEYVRIRELFHAYLAYRGKYKKYKKLVNKIFTLVNGYEKGKIEASEVMKKLHNLYKNKSRMLKTYDKKEF